VGVFFSPPPRRPPPNAARWRLRARQLVRTRAPRHVTAQGDPEPPARAAPLPWSHPPKAARLGASPARARPHGAPHGGSPEKNPGCRLPRRHAQVLPAQPTGLGPGRSERAPTAAAAPPAGGHRGTSGPLGAPFTPPGPRRTRGPCSPAPAHRPTGRGQGQRRKGKKTGDTPPSSTARGPGGCRRCWPASPREPPPLQAPGAAGPVDGRVFICTNLAKDRADAQRLVATRLLDRVHDPLGHFSRLQRIHPRAR
jgi:hypothetical protein